MRDKPDVIDAEFEIIQELPKPRQRYGFYMAPGWQWVVLVSGVLGLLAVLRP